MTQDEWNSSTDASAMLHALHDRKPFFFRRSIRQIQRFLIACNWKNEHLIPQYHLRNGLRGAERWLDRKIDYEELNRLNWHAEAEAFRLDYAKKPEEFDSIRAMVSGIPELDGMPFDEARDVLKRAAYFAEVAMVFSGMRPRPRAWLSIISKNAEFLCADLLRDHLKPNFS